MSYFLKLWEGYYIAFLHAKKNSTKAVLLILIAEK